MEKKDLDLKKDVVESDDLGIGSFDDLDQVTVAAEAAEATRQRYAIVFDATGSMQSWWRAAEKALHKALDDIKNRSDVPVQVKVVGYRDHECDPDNITTASEWSDDNTYLKEFISNMRIDGGGDYPESPGHGLKEILQQNCNMVILLGDAPGKQGSMGYPEATICAKDKCPIHCLYVTEEHQLVENWKEIARLSGGKAMHLKDAGNFTDILKTLMISNKRLAIDYQPETEEGKRIKALLS